MEFDETPKFWYPRIGRDAWINFSSLTVELRSSECRENLFFFFSLSLSLRLLLSLSSLLFSFLLSSSSFYLSIEFLHSCLLPSLFLNFSFFFSTEFIKVGETSLHFPLSHLSSPCIFLIFLDYFSFFFITSFNTWLNGSHLFQVHHMAHATCHFLRVPCGITWLCHVTRHSVFRKM